MLVSCASNVAHIDAGTERATRLPNPGEGRRADPFAIMPCSERSTCRILVIEFLTHPGDLMSNKQFVIRRVMPGHIRKREVMVRKQERIDTQPFPGTRAVQIGMAIDQIKR